MQLNVGGGEDSCSEVKEDDGGTESSRSNSAAVKRNKKKKNRKKVTKASKAAAVKSSEDNLEDIEDEIDRSVREVNKILGKAPNAQESIHLFLKNVSALDRLWFVKIDAVIWMNIYRTSSNR